MNHWNHPEYKALYAAVMAAPKDDTPRLILCDWLEDRSRDEFPLSHHHARFIRLQVEFAGLYQPENRPAASAAEDRRQDRIEKEMRTLFQLLPLHSIHGKPKPSTNTWNPANVRYTHATQYHQYPAVLCWRGFYSELVCDGPWLASGRWKKLRRLCPITDVWLVDRQYPNLTNETETTIAEVDGRAQKVAGTFTIHHQTIPAGSTGVRLPFLANTTSHDVPRRSVT